MHYTAEPESVQILWSVDEHSYKDADGAIKYHPEPTIRWNQEYNKPITDISLAQIQKVPVVWGHHLEV